MSKYGVELSIDVTKIDKDRLFVGKKGKYLSATVFIDTDNVSQFGDNGMIVHKATKEESDAKTKTPILGNVKVFWSDDPSFTKPQAPQQGQQVDNAPDFDDPNSIPF